MVQQIDQYLTAVHASRIPISLMLITFITSVLLLLLLAMANSMFMCSPFDPLAIPIYIYIYIYIYIWTTSSKQALAAMYIDEIKYIIKFQIPFSTEAKHPSGFGLMTKP